MISDQDNMDKKDEGKQGPKKFWKVVVIALAVSVFISVLIMTIELIALNFIMK